MKEALKFSSSCREITRITVTMEITKGLYITKAQEAFGKVCEKLDDYQLGSISLSSYSTSKSSIHTYVIIFNRTFNYPSDITKEVKLIFSMQDWGVKKRTEENG